MKAPFQRADLDWLDEFIYSRAVAVVPMREIHDGMTSPRVIGLRHDVDNIIEPAVEMAAWEHERGYRSTYFILHTAPYWKDKRLLRESLETIAYLGHEIGIHNNAVTVALRTGRDPVEILREATEELRSYGYEIRGTAAHGDQLCYHAKFVNDEIFTECPRPDWGEPARPLTLDGKTVELNPVPLAELGLEYDSIWLPRGAYLSDSGGHWNITPQEVAYQWPTRGQLHMLVHPDWWPQAFTN